MEGPQGLQAVYRRLYARRIGDGDEYTADIWRRGGWVYVHVCGESHVS